MNFFTPRSYTGTHAWEALPIAEIEGATVRLHYTDAPYVWHVNDGEEVFVVLDGTVVMHYRQNGVEYARRLNPGDICHAAAGDEHVAHPDGIARVLVIEKKGSV